MKCEEDDKMKKMKITMNMKENGLTLIEVVASIVILTLIITTFLMMFLQSAKTNKTSETIIDSTYYAQIEMENIHAISQETSFGAIETTMKELLNYDSVDSQIFMKTDSESGKYFEVRLIEREDSQLVELLVRIYNNKDKEKLEAQMETILSWEGIEE